jgi:hypothetical protein
VSVVSKLRQYSEIPQTLGSEYSHVFTILKDRGNQLFLQTTYTLTNTVTYSPLGEDPLEKPVVAGGIHVTSLAGQGEFRVEVEMVGSYVCGVAGEPGRE